MQPVAAALALSEPAAALPGTLWSSSSSSSSSCTTRRYFSAVHRYRVAIVGSGPSGCYTAKYLRSSFAKMKQDQQQQGVEDNDSNCDDWRIDVLERLPTPYGLVRYGVAPDHPEVKNVQNDFDSLFSVDDDEENGGSIRFLGNVRVGRDVSVDELRRRYDAVVLAYGCESDKKLGLPGEDDLCGVLSAREFVAWYNGHPDFVHVGDQVARALGSRAGGDGVLDASVVVIGQGNVALDCARILAKGRSGLYDTDATSAAIDVLGEGIESISVVGRRGPAQAAFTIKEVRELVKLSADGHDANLVVSSAELDLGETAATREELSEVPAGRPKKRIHKLLREAADREPDPGLSKEVRLRFLLRPVGFEPSSSDDRRLGAVVFERTELCGTAFQQRAEGTGALERVAADLALVSIGYRALALPGIEQWFDETTGVLRHEMGRVDRGSDDGDVPAVGGLYCAGWLKRGPTGIIGTNIADAKETVSTVLTDLAERDLDGERGGEAGGDNLQALLKERGVRVVQWDGYRRIEEKELLLRRSEKQPREKITDLQLQLKTALAAAR